MIEEKEAPLLELHLVNISVEWHTKSDHNQNSGILVALNYVTHIIDMIEEKEAPLLELHLVNISVEWHNKPDGFTLKFYFNSTIISAQPEFRQSLKVLCNDFNIGMLLRNLVIPRAVLFITGEAVEDDDDEDEDDEGQGCRKLDYFETR